MGGKITEFEKGAKAENLRLTEAKECGSMIPMLVEAMVPAKPSNCAG